MPFRPHVVVLLVAVALPACAPSTRSGQTRLAVGGAAVAAAGGVLWAKNNEPSGEPCPGYAPCELDRTIAQTTGELMMITGAVMLAVAGVGALNTYTDEAQAQPLPGETRVAVDVSACVVWNQEIEAERDPSRRGALRAARPPECAEPAAPGQIAAPVDR